MRRESQELQLAKNMTQPIQNQATENGVAGRPGGATQAGAVPAHGGRLLDRVADGPAREELVRATKHMPRIALNNREASDLEMLAIGAFSPLEGFMIEEDYQSVVERMRLAKGLPWSIPITLASRDTQGAAPGSDVALEDASGRLLAVMRIESRYQPDKNREAERVLRTLDASHPGARYLNSVGKTYLGGPVTVLDHPTHRSFPEFYLTPKETRVLFKSRGWRTVAAFQTRNPIHRAHEYLQKCALEMVDGLLIHPLVGETKEDDIPADVRMKCYQVLLERYYPRTRVALSIFPAAMRYAGPREAIFHALVRKNYGCSHFIVGRDHAGVGSFYGPFDAHRIFDEFGPGELGVTPILFDHAFFCRTCGAMASPKTCPHSKGSHIALSGSELRKILQRGEMPPSEMTRPEVAKILMGLLDNMKKEEGS